ncbi:hypothetical protein B0H16DRAFT_1786129 [Mycena metata]|uniref:Uncharacterized protein n=1 Tax=Mycena metata TaxID=1033252 RepID=A0AAD7HPE8_9AGAR|nr:hypothetical protein B0H16DRAFT_1786129 [Mycena metata]
MHAVPSTYNANAHTPTAANRYAQPPPQFLLPQQPSQMDLLVSMMEQVLEGQQNLGQRVAALEARVSDPVGPESARGVAARGGRAPRAKTRASTRRIQQHEAIDPSLRDSEPGSIASSTDLATDTELEPESVDEDGVDWDSVDLLPTEKRALQIVKEVLEELKNVKARPAGLIRVHDPQPTWDLAFLQILGKQSFRSLKRQWNDSKKLQAGIETGTNLQTNRQTKRRDRKSSQLQKIIEKFAAKYGVSVKFLRDIVDEQYLSDEVSGPEAGSGETKPAWKVRLAAAANLPLDAESLKDISILEKLIPEWRSDDYSDVIHKLQKFRLDNPTKKQQTKSVYHRICLGRTSARVPQFAPYNFGVSREWLDKHRDERAYRRALKDWGAWPEPADSGLERLLDIDVTVHSE